ncbi:unnamed protein product [Danaus chrysippus]|uniref:(African queen) hypothetical protein n=1 Tax=Danaus chrysippus TaxID=151541 RepID=A0A8J2VWA6_9NEOP|nr:unnamed protein product [Danaus chrysippus]
MYHGNLESVPCEPKVYVEMSPGDTVFFHPLIVHGSGENITQIENQKVLSEVGFEPTPSERTRTTHTRSVASKGNLESGALDRSAILTDDR